MLNECNGCEYKCSLSHIDICTLGSPCPHQKLLTNEEYILTCSTEELAIFLCNELQHDVNGTLENRFFKKLYSQYPIRPMNAYHEVMRWLKEKHNE